MVDFPGLQQNNFQQNSYPSCPDNVLNVSPEMLKGSSDLGDREPK